MRVLSNSTVVRSGSPVAPHCGDPVVVSGAGGVGSIAVQLAALAGATVIGLANPAHHDWLASHGVIPRPTATASQTGSASPTATSAPSSIRSAVTTVFGFARRHTCGGGFGVPAGGQGRAEAPVMGRHEATGRGRARHRAGLAQRA
jgi:hypothetical protein